MMFELANNIEAFFWILLAFGLGAYGIVRQTPHRAEVAWLSVTLIFFGISDVVEVQTGAWWRPWWLLVWKGMCISSILVVTIRYYRRRIKQNEKE